MNLLLIYDTETTGFPLWKQPSDDPGQPHIVQMAAKLIDLETRKTHQAIDLIIRPDGWNIPEEVSEIHGITTEHATAVGIPELDAVSVLMRMSKVADIRIAHNESFDSRIMRIALKRFYSVFLADEWRNRPAECTMRMSTPICNLPGKRPGGPPKWPKLSEAYSFFMGEEMENAHNAIADVEACVDVYFAMVDGGHLS